ncbi:MAG: DUF996 domain-containing protein [candidate division WOR-3 bacterium]
MNGDVSNVNIGKENKLAGISVILLILGPFFLGLPSLIGIILLLVALYRISSKLKIDAFRKVLIATIVFLIGLIIASIISFSFMFAGHILGSMFRTDNFELTEYIISEFLSTFLPLVMLFFFFLIMYAITLYSSYLIKKAFEGLAYKTRYNLFRTGGAFIWWGALLSIVLVGLLLSLIGWIILAVAFFKSPGKIQVL